MTREELLQLSTDELVDKVLELEKSRNYWSKEHYDVTKKFKLYRDAVTSVVLFID